MSEYKRLKKRKKDGSVALTFSSIYPQVIIRRLKDRLAELDDKLESGQLVELPCKVGDKVYEVFKEHKPPFIKETTIEKIVITEKGFKLRLSRNSVYETAISSLGKTVFLTKAEAEARLKELQEEKK